MNHFTTFLRDKLAGRKQNEVAAQMGITPSQLNKAMNGGGCERTTLAKIVAGISDTPELRADCLAEYLRDFLPLAGDDARLISITIKPSPGPKARRRKTLASR